MKKPSKLALYALTASFFVVTTPLDASYFPNQKNSLETTLRCAASEHPDTSRVHTPEEISQIIHEVYEHTFNEPDYFSEKLVRELILNESEYNPRAKSRKGAIGLMQITPVAWDEVEKECSYEKYVLNPRKNLEVGMKYLLLLDEFSKENHPKWEKLSPRERRNIILASYNGGISRLSEREWDVNEMYKETRDYVEMVMGGLED
ncbi:MAG TPA: lytic transglycosylase domain-containing protein [Candidatus Pacearchaeota archaeon]|nr:lytic transglycosylase domain-containing protein [Candidatus Pacearchaeota archaeon]